jgi:hypothetical protein
LRIGRNRFNLVLYNSVLVIGAADDVAGRIRMLSQARSRQSHCGAG